MQSAQTMQASKIRTIEGKYATAIRNGPLKNDVVVVALFACLLNRQHIMSEIAKANDDSVIEILIRIKSGHRKSCSGIATDGSFNFLSMFGRIFPSRSQVV